MARSAALALALLWSAPAASAAWRCVGPGTGPVARLAFGGPGGPVYAVTDAAGVFRSDDRGLSWTAASGGLASATSLRAFVAAGADGRALLVAGLEEGLFRSIDGGAHWSRANAGLPPVSSLPWPVVTSLASDHGAPETLFAGGAFNVFRSGDLGATWISTGLHDQMVTSVAVPSGSTERVYAVSTDGVFRSTNGGATWRDVAVYPAFPGSGILAVDPGSPATLFAASAAGLWKSTDGADTWTRLDSGLPSPTYPDYHLVAALAFDAFDHETLYAAAARAGLHRSSDGGATWSALPTPPDTTSVVADPVLPGRLLAGTAGEGILESTDRGATWCERNQGFCSATVRNAAVRPENPKVIFASADGADGEATLFRTLDAGATWLPLPGLGECRAGAVRAGGADPSTVLAGCGGISRSTDGGATFLSVFDAGGGTIERFAGSAISPATVFASGEGPPGGPEGDTGPLLLRSGDGGAHWTVSSTPPCHVGSIAVSPVTPGLVYVGARFYWRDTWFGVYRSTDGGATFERTSYPNVPVPAIAIDPVTGAVWAAASSGLLRSTDGGDSWASFGPDLEGHTVTSLAFDASGALVAGTLDGVFRCADGRTFQDVTGDLGATRVLTVVPAGDRLYAGTIGGGLVVLEPERPGKIGAGGGPAPGTPVRGHR